jgi:cytochrome P450
MPMDESIDPTDPGFFTRPDYHQVLARLRDEAPVFPCTPGMWTVARYEDIRDISRDPGHFCSSQGALINDPLRGEVNPMTTPSILHMDPPEHSAFRGLVNRRFTPRALAGLADLVRQSSRSIINAASADEEIDFVSELSAPFPLGVIAELLGIDEADRSDFRRWSDAAIESPDLPARSHPRITR